MMPPWYTLALVCVLALLGVRPASAHPHVFVSVVSSAVFGADGKITGIRHEWTFDEMYSAFAVEGMKGAGTGPSEAELAGIAKQNVEDLAQYGWFTRARAGKEPVAFNPPMDYSVVRSADTGNLQLRFTLPFKEPANPGRAFTFEVYDPSYFVAFSFDEKTQPTLVGAPSGCSISLFKPKPLDAGMQAKLNESFFSGLSPGADFGVQLAERVIVACP